LNAFNASGLQRALFHLEQASMLEPQNVYVLRGMGRACWAALNHGLSNDVTLLEKALAHAETIARIQPDSPYVQEIRGLVAAASGDLETALRNLAIAHEAMPADEDIAVWYGVLMMFACQVDPAVTLAHDILRSHDSGFAKLIIRASGHFRGDPQRVRAAFDTGPENCPVLPWFLFQTMAGLADGNHEHVLRVVTMANTLPPDPLVSMATFLGAAVRGDAAAAAVALAPEIEAALWHDFQYPECVAEGFALLGDEANVVKWLGRSVELGMGYLAPILDSHAVWHPWRDHRLVAPLFARCREHAARYAMMPIAPRVLKLMESTSPSQ
jgi:hypothetical protein